MVCYFTQILICFYLDLFWHSNYLPFASDFKLTSVFFAKSPSFRNTLSLLSTKRYLSLILYFPNPSPGISHISKEAGPFYRRLVARRWVPGAMSLLLGFCFTQVLSMAKAEEYMHIFLSFSFFLPSFLPSLSLSVSLSLSLSFILKAMSSYTCLQFQSNSTFHFCNSILLHWKYGFHSHYSYYVFLFNQCPCLKPISHVCHSPFPCMARPLLLRNIFIILLRDQQLKTTAFLCPPRLPMAPAHRPGCLLSPFPPHLA